MNNLSYNTRNSGYSSFFKGSYCYQVNGMEVNNKPKGNGNSSTTEYKQYTPRLARWLIVASLSDKAPGWSPYRAFFDNPIIHVDSDGCYETKKEARKARKYGLHVEKIYSEKGNYVFNVNTDSERMTSKDATDFSEYQQNNSSDNSNQSDNNGNSRLNAKDKIREADCFVAYYYEWSAYNILSRGDSTGTLVAQHHGTHDYDTHSDGTNIKSELFSMEPGYGVIMSTGHVSEVPLKDIMNFPTNIEISAIVIDVGSKIAISKPYDERGVFLLCLVLKFLNVLKLHM